jgi:hypothetical protein
MDASEHAEPGVSPFSGVAPPEETRWRPGLSANPGGQPQGKGFRKFLRSYFEKPETRQLLLDKIRRDLAGDGHATFTLKCLAYVYGEPKQTVEINLQSEAERLALQAGVPVAEVLAEVAQMAAGPN